MECGKEGGVSPPASWEKDPGAWLRLGLGSKDDRFLVACWYEVYYFAIQFLPECWFPLSMYVRAVLCCAHVCISDTYSVANLCLHTQCRPNAKSEFIHVCISWHNHTCNLKTCYTHMSMCTYDLIRQLLRHFIYSILCDSILLLKYYLPGTSFFKQLLYSFFNVSQHQIFHIFYWNP